jgi:prevent-host-death family protein
MYIKGGAMKTATFSDLRNNAKKYFDIVEHGGSVEVFRHGKPVAVIMPYKSGLQKARREVAPLKLAGVSISRAILQERQTSRS